MAFTDFVKNLYLKIRKKEEPEADEIIDLKHAALESTEGKDLDLAENEDALADKDSEEAERIEKAAVINKAGVVTASDGEEQKPEEEKKEGKEKEEEKDEEPVKKVNLVCNACNYKFIRSEENIPKMCPYCGKDL